MATVSLDTFFCTHPKWDLVSLVFADRTENTYQCSTCGFRKNKTIKKGYKKK